MGGCGSCGKPKPAPTGSTKITVPKPASSTTADAKKSPTSLGGQTQSFRLLLANGTTMRIQGTLLEARSMLIRKGGGRIEL